MLHVCYYENVKIFTSSGATYDISDGICVKTDHVGYVYPPFKVWTIKVVDDTIGTWEDIHTLPISTPEIGKRFYIGGKDIFWLSTIVERIEE